MAVKNTKCVEAPLKLFVEDMKRIQCSDSHEFPFKINLPNDSLDHSVVKFSHIWLQGHIETVDPVLDEILLRDHTGSVRITNCSKVPGDRSWLASGRYSGVLARVSKAPAPRAHVLSAVKLMDISNDHAEEMWPYEVKELFNFLMDLIVPSLE